MERWLFAIEEVFATDGVFPAHRIVQRMRTGIAPMAIEVVLGERRARAGKLEELVGRGDGDFRREDLRLGSDDLGVRDRFRIRVFNRTVDGAAGLFEERLCRMKPQRQVADGLDRVGIIRGALKTAIGGTTVAEPNSVHLFSKELNCRFLVPTALFDRFRQSPRSTTNIRPSGLNWLTTALKPQPFNSNASPSLLKQRAPSTPTDPESHGRFG